MAPARTSRTDSPRPMYLANRPVQSRHALEVFDKYDGSLLARVAAAEPRHVEQAIAAAVAAEPKMRALPPHARRDVLLHLVARCRERAEEFALTLCEEAGKPVQDARGEVVRLIETLQEAADEATRVGGELMELGVAARVRGMRGITQRVPIGACSFITPFNFPLNLVAHKVGPAIAAGCPFVLKPADKTPLGALLLAELLAETDLPRGAFSVLPVPLEHAAPLVEDPRVKLLSFTGGEVGWALKARAGRKKVTLELGGNAACVVDGDQGSSLERVAERIVFGGYYQSGQSCISVQRVIAHKKVYKALKEQLIPRVEALVHGNPRSERTFVGPVIDRDAAVRIERWIEQAQAKGAKLLVGGSRRGSMVRASLLEKVPRECDLYRREVFGPVVLLERADSFEHALELANDSEYGLQTGVFTERLQHAMQAWNQLEVGGVVIGDVPSVRVDRMPYGGVKGSGCGREGVRSAIEDMTEPRLLVLSGALSG